MGKLVTLTGPVRGALTLPNRWRVARRQVTIDLLAPRVAAPRSAPVLDSRLFGESGRHGCSDKSGHGGSLPAALWFGR